MTTATDLDRQALMAEIVVNPTDLLPRLQIADWFEENGDTDRAEFIRLDLVMRYTRRQNGDLEIVHRKAMSGDVEINNPDQWNRRNKLLADRWRGWLIEIGLAPGQYESSRWLATPGVFSSTREGDAFRASFQGGFVAEVRCTLDAWRRHGGTLVTRCPLTWVGLTDFHPRGECNANWYKTDERYGDPTPGRPFVLPVEVFDRLDGVWSHPFSDRSIKKYYTELAARQALSDALLGMVRDQTS